MHQNWGRLLFIHWPVNKDQLRPFIPAELALDTFEGSAWITLTPFTIWDGHLFPPFALRLPGLSSMHELNLRTYVRYEGMPGVWFFSLDTNSWLATVGARTFFHLPYYRAMIEVKQDAAHIDYKLKRIRDRAYFEASWNVEAKMPQSVEGSREYFLTERYCLYSRTHDKLYRARIHHQPWPLQHAHLDRLSSNIIERHELLSPKGEPVIHYAEEVSVDIWPPELMARVS